MHYNLNQHQESCESKIKPLRNLAAAVINRAFADIGVDIDRKRKATPDLGLKYEELQEILNWFFDNSKKEGSLYFWASYLTDDPQCYIQNIRSTINANKNKVIKTFQEKAWKASHAQVSDIFFNTEVRHANL